MTIPHWLSFLLALTIIMIIARKELSVGLILGAFTFALLTGISLWGSFLNIIIDFQTILLCIIVVLIPVLGNLLEKNQYMKRILDDFNLKPRSALMITPAIFGLLPVAGGALMSAPLINQIDDQNTIPAGKKLAINVWFRHVLVMVYPLSSELLIASQLSGLTVYTQICALLLPCAIMIGMGYFFLIGTVDLPKILHKSNFKRASIHFIPVLITPVIDLLFRALFPDFEYPRLFMLLGIILSLGTALYFTKHKFSFLFTIAKEANVWRYPLMIVSIFWFLAIFEASNVPTQIQSLHLPFLLFLLLGFALGFATGRVALPCTILFPLYLSQNALSIFSIPEFALLYFIIFSGYLITPIHPCVAYSAEHFKIKQKEYLKYFLKPIGGAISLGLMVYYIIVLIR